MRHRGVFTKAMEDARYDGTSKAESNSSSSPMSGKVQVLLHLLQEGFYY